MTASVCHLKDIRKHCLSRAVAYCDCCFCVLCINTLTYLLIERGLVNVEYGSY